MTTIKWLLEEVPVNKQIDAYFRVSGDVGADLPLNNFSITSSSLTITEDRENESLIKKETLIMPEDYDEVDN